MKALSVRQPFAWAIDHGGKDIENRSWAKNNRRPLQNHAGMRWHDVTPAMLARRMGSRCPRISPGEASSAGSRSWTASSPRKAPGSRGRTGSFSPTHVRCRFGPWPESWVSSTCRTTSTRTSRLRRSVAPSTETCSIWTRSDQPRTLVISLQPNVDAVDPMPVRASKYHGSCEGAAGRRLMSRQAPVAFACSSPLLIRVWEPT